MWPAVTSVCHLLHDVLAAAVYRCWVVHMQHLLKDIKLFASEAEKVDLDNNLLKGLEAVIASTVERGLADTDYSAVHEGILEPSVTA